MLSVEWAQPGTRTKRNISPMNLVAVPHGGISPRILSPMKVSADSRRRLRFRGL